MENLTFDDYLNELLIAEEQGTLKVMPFQRDNKQSCRFTVVTEKTNTDKATHLRAYLEHKYPKLQVHISFDYEYEYVIFDTYWNTENE